MTRLRIGRSNAPGDFRTKPREVLDVPRVDSLRPCFDGAMGKKRVVNGAAREAERGGRLKRLEVFLVIDMYDRQPLTDITEEQHRFVTADTLSACPAGEGGINFRQAMSPATGFMLVEVEKEIDARLMKLMMRVKGRNQYGSVKERFHLGRSPVF